MIHICDTGCAYNLFNMYERLTKNEKEKNEENQRERSVRDQVK